MPTFEDMCWVKYDDKDPVLLSWNKAGYFEDCKRKLMIHPDRVRAWMYPVKPVFYAM